ncbi:shikimate kinase AroL [Erwinia oleae]|uniref:shikimate kinase AroL n=1 Tax=Erwinia oleae TaxID=796334 RepID=UPI0005516758|nr:shikimate kinase AroL [Erwinia oleae]
MALPLYLIGARGCGKTTVGQKLADALGYAFCDTDRHLQQVSGRSVEQIVAAEGWQSFRQQETLALHAVTAPDTVIATGGGMVLAPENCRYMREHGQVIYLNAEAGILAARLEADPEQAQRPTLTGRPIVDEVDEVLAARDTLYQNAAHRVVNAMQSPEGVIEEIITLLALASAG